MTLLCVPLVARTVEEMVADAAAAAVAGADLVEIRLDFIQEFRPREHLPQLLRGCTLPALVTYRFVRPPLARPLPLCFPAMASALGFDSFHRFRRHFRISGARCGDPSGRARARQVLAFDSARHAASFVSLRVTVKSLLIIQSHYVCHRLRLACLRRCFDGSKGTGGMKYEYKSCPFVTVGILNISP